MFLPEGWHSLNQTSVVTSMDHLIIRLYTSRWKALDLFTFESPRDYYGTGYMVGTQRKGREDGKEEGGGGEE